MSDTPEVTTTQAKSTQQVAETPVETDWRKNPAAQQVFAELNELRAKLDKEAAEKAQREEAEALKRGEHEQVIAKLRAEAESTKAALEKTQRDNGIKFALLEHGISDPLLIAGALSLYDGTDFAEYAAKIAADRQGDEPRGLRPPPSVTPATVGKSYGQQLRAQLDDPATARQASAAVTKYVAEHGVLPPGFK